jgi:hypothetical protein
MKLIRLTQGQFAQVDDADYDWLNQWKWRAKKSTNTYYAVRTDYSNGKKTVGMGRVMLGLTDSEVDAEHRDRNGLNNQRLNLRPATCQQNGINKSGYSKSSQYKGVYYNKERRMFSAQIKYNYKSRHIGHFKSEIDAARAYDRKALELFGEFAYLNFEK